MRELREFREAYPEFQAAGVPLAGVSGDSVESHRAWIERLHLPFPLLSDPERGAGRALGLVRRLGFGAWAVELFRRATLLADEQGIVAAAWGDVKVRGTPAGSWRRSKCCAGPGRLPAESEGGGPRGSQTCGRALTTIRVRSSD